MSFGDRSIVLAFIAVGIVPLVFAIVFISYFAVREPDRLQSEAYRLEDRRLTLQSKEHRVPIPVEREEVTAESTAADHWLETRDDKRV